MGAGGFFKQHCDICTWRAQMEIHVQLGQECVQPQSFRVRVRVSHYVFSLTKTAERPYAYIVKKANVSALLRLGLS